MQFTIESGRQTGRTTRMLRAAYAMAITDRQVVIVALDDTNLRQLQAQFQTLTGNAFNLPNLSFTSWPRIRASLDMMALTVRSGSFADAKLYFDHSIFQRLYGRIIEEYHAYDIEPITYEQVAEVAEDNDAPVIHWTITDPDTSGLKTGDPLYRAVDNTAAPDTRFALPG